MEKFKIGDLVYYGSYDPCIAEIRSRRKLGFFGWYYIVGVRGHIETWEEYERNLIPYL